MLNRSCLAGLFALPADILAYRFTFGLIEAVLFINRLGIRESLGILFVSGFAFAKSLVEFVSNFHWTYFSTSAAACAFVCVNVTRLLLDHDFEVARFACRADNLCIRIGADI